MKKQKMSVKAEINELLDQMVLRKLREMNKGGDPPTAAFLKALTSRYGRPDISADELGDLQKQLRLVSKEVMDGEQETDQAEAS